MSNRPKPKSNAVLKNLPDERQEQIVEWCDKPNDRDADGKAIPLTGGLAFARAQLAADGIKVSLSLLSEFCASWRLDQDLTISELREQQVLEQTGDLKRAREAGEALLLRLGLAKQDPELIATGTRISDNRRKLDLDEASAKTKGRQKERALNQKDASLALDWHKFTFDGAKAALAHLAELKAIARDSSLNADAKIAAVQLKLFGPVPAEFAAKFSPGAKA